MLAMISYRSVGYAAGKTDKRGLNSVAVRFIVLTLLSSDLGGIDDDDDGAFPNEEEEMEN